MLQYRAPGECVTVVIAGELDHYAAPQIRAMLDEFEGYCEGSISMFESRMEILARKLCGGGDADE